MAKVDLVDKAGAFREVHDCYVIRVEDCRTVRSASDETPRVAFFSVPETIPKLALGDKPVLEKCWDYAKRTYLKDGFRVSLYRLTNEAVPVQHVDVSYN